MIRRVWELREARNKLSSVIDHVLRKGPQLITCGGKEIAVVLSREEYRKLLRTHEKLSEFFQESPLAGIKLGPKRDSGTVRDEALR